MLPDHLRTLPRHQQGQTLGVTASSLTATCLLHQDTESICHLPFTRRWSGGRCGSSPHCHRLRRGRGDRCGGAVLSLCRRCPATAQTHHLGPERPLPGGRSEETPSRGCPTPPAEREPPEEPPECPQAPPAPAHPDCPHPPHPVGSALPCGRVPPKRLANTANDPLGLPRGGRAKLLAPLSNGSSWEKCKCLMKKAGNRAAKQYVQVGGSTGLWPGPGGQGGMARGPPGTGAAPQQPPGPPPAWLVLGAAADPQIRSGRQLEDRARGTQPSLKAPAGAPKTRTRKPTWEAPGDPAHPALRTVHGHLVDLRGVVLLDVPQDADVVVLHEVDGHALPAVPARPPDPWGGAG